MYSFQDYRNLGTQDVPLGLGSKTKDPYRISEPKLCTDKNSIFGHIYNNPSFSRFKTIIERSGMVGQLDQLQADFTLLVPEDKYLRHIPDSYFKLMDDGLARQILNSSLIKRKIGSGLLKSSPCAYYATMNPEMRMYITNIRGVTRVNNIATVVKFDVCLDNGLIHIIDGLIIPSDAHFMN